MNVSPRHMNIPIFISHLGCPHTCVFCDQRRISGQQRPIEPDKIRKLIEDWLAASKPHETVEIAFFGGSFTGIPRGLMTAYLQTAYAYVQEGRVSSIRISTRPDYIDRDTLDILKKYGVRVIELGVQSLDDEVLALSERGHTAAEVYRASGLIKEYGFALGIQIMPGLPGDTLERTLATARKVVALEPQLVRIYPAVTLKGTAMEELIRTGAYKPLSLEEAITWCAELVPLFREAGIDIVKMGLHYSELLESSVVAGPFHPAFGELVASRVLLNQICEAVEENHLQNCLRILIRTRKGWLSKALGQKRENITRLKDKYGFKEVRVEEAELPSSRITVMPWPIEGENHEVN